MTYGYELSGYISGVMVKDDTSYSYTKQSGFKEPKLILSPFNYYTEIKVDSRGNRALQSIYSDDTKQEKINSIVQDFENARTSYFYQYGECRVSQYNSSIMSIGEVLRILWTPNTKNVF